MRFYIKSRQFLTRWCSHLSPCTNFTTDLNVHPWSVHCEFALMEKLHTGAAKSVGVPVVDPRRGARDAHPPLRQFLRKTGQNTRVTPHLGRGGARAEILDPLLVPLYEESWFRPSSSLSDVFLCFV